MSCISDEPKNPSYFLFYTHEADHLDSDQHSLVAYTLEKYNGLYEFNFFKSCHLKKREEDVKTQNYFD